MGKINIIEIYNILKFLIKIFMKIILQRVSSASVAVDGKIVGQIEKWLLLLVWVWQSDTKEDANKLAKKVLNLRIFRDENDKMNLSVQDIGGKILSVSQFTLFADCKKWNRPSFVNAWHPEIAKNLWEYFNEKLRENIPVETGVFGADMKVSLENDGPVTIVLDSGEL